MAIDNCENISCNSSLYFATLYKYIPIMIEASRLKTTDKIIIFMGILKMSPEEIIERTLKKITVIRYM